MNLLRSWTSFFPFIYFFEAQPTRVCFHFVPDLAVFGHTQQAYRVQWFPCIYHNWMGLLTQLGVKSVSLMMDKSCISSAETGNGNGKKCHWNDFMCCKTNFFHSTRIPMTWLKSFIFCLIFIFVPRSTI